MNFNDQIHPQDAFALQNEQEEFYHEIILQSANYEKRPPIKSKLGKDNTSKASLMRGKQNESLNEVHFNNKSIVTNHSFNGFFNQNSQKIKKTAKQSTNKRIELNDISNQTYQINNQQNIDSSGKMSSFQSIGDSSKNISYNKESIHQEVKSFIKKYFPENYQSSNFQGQYFSIQDFVEILFEEFQSLIGKKNSFNLIEHFTDKIFLIFEDKIYFNELFQKTSENGLTGLIFQIVKAINEDKHEVLQSKENKITLKLNQIPKPKNLLSSKNLLSLNSQFQKNQNSRQIIKGSDSNLQNSNLNRSNISKISLDKFFGNSISKIQQIQNSKAQFNQESKLFCQDQARLQDQNLQEVKAILQNYIEQMYSEAEQKLTKKYTQQMRKITLKYKEAQKLLERVNQKISNHYDSIQLEKQYEKKIKLMTQKESQLQNRIKKIEEETKIFKDEAEKHKLNCFKQDQELTKLKEKLEKYQNAFFEKAMQKAPNQNTINANNRTKEQVSANSSIYSQQGTQFLQEKASQIPRFELKVDTFTEHRPIVVPLTPSNRPPSYSPHLSRQLSGALTPTRLQTMEGSSVSPLKQRISFIKAPHAVSNLRLLNGNQQSTSPSGNNSRIIYSTISTLQGNQGMKTGGNQLEMGEKIQLRSLSPIGKLGESNLNGVKPISGNSRLQINTAVSTGHVQQRYGLSQQWYSPLKVEFCTSQVSGTSMQSR